MITRQENIPMCFLQKVHSFFSTTRSLWAERSCSFCLTPAAEALAEHRDSARTCLSALALRRAFQSTQSVHWAAKSLCFLGKTSKNSLLFNIKLRARILLLAFCSLLEELYQGRVSHGLFFRFSLHITQQWHQNSLKQETAKYFGSAALAFSLVLLGWDATLHVVLLVRQTLLREDENSCNSCRKEKRKAAVKGTSSCILEMEAKWWSCK